MGTFTTMVLGTNVSSVLPILTLSSIPFHAVFIFQVPSPTGNLKAEMGFSSNASIASPTDGMFFQVGTSGVWQAVTSSGGSSTVVSGPSIDTSWHTFEIRNDVTGTAISPVNNVSFWTDGMLVGTGPITTNITSAALVPFFSIAPTTSSARAINIDAFQLTMGVTR